MGLKIFIDGEVGTTGLEIRERLLKRDDISLLPLDLKDRKNKKIRSKLLNEASIAILCLPDDAAREAVSLIENNSTRVIDASSAHRTTKNWVYGFPEYNAKQSELIAKASRVSNPGCYAVGSVSIIRPLIASGVLPSDWPISINAISGYSGGGRLMIESFEDENKESKNNLNYFSYGLSLQHKHIPEITLWSGLQNPPIFSPSVGRYRQGMIVQVPLPVWALRKACKISDVCEIYETYYRKAEFVTVCPISSSYAIEKMNPEGLNGTNFLRIFVFGNDSTNQLTILALLDNLGKGASGQVIQNMNLMMGIPENTGL